MEKMPALPSPWTALKAISSFMDCDCPERTDPARKRTTATSTTALRPYRSDIFPKMGIIAVEARR